MSTTTIEAKFPPLWSGSVSATFKIALRGAEIALPGWGRARRRVKNAKNAARASARTRSHRTRGAAPPLLLGAARRAQAATLKVLLITSVIANVVLVGANFGPAGIHEQSYATFGPTGVEQTGVDCEVVTAHTHMRCTMGPGVGKQLSWRVVVGGQRSAAAGARR